MAKTLVAYFSATRTTARAAAFLAYVIDSDLYEINPEVPYTIEDLNWQDPNSRSSIEMNDPASRPALTESVEEAGEYDLIFLGFPIWWGVAPKIINTFLEQIDLNGTTIVPFATSGGSGMEEVDAALRPSCPGADLKEGTRFPADVSEEELKAWAEQYL